MQAKANWSFDTGRRKMWWEQATPKRTPKWTTPEGGRPTGTSDALAQHAWLAPSSSAIVECQFAIHMIYVYIQHHYNLPPYSRVVSHHHPFALSQIFFNGPPAQGRSGTQWAAEARAGLPGTACRTRVWPRWESPASLRPPCAICVCPKRHCAHTTRPRELASCLCLSPLSASLRARRRPSSPRPLACGGGIEHKTTPNRAWGKVARAEFCWANRRQCDIPSLV